MIRKIATAWPTIERRGLAVLTAAVFVISVVEFALDNTSVARFWLLTGLVTLALRQLETNSSTLSSILASQDRIEREQADSRELLRRKSWGSAGE